ncbi:MAG: hypothetical protein ACLU4N_20905 [Butyricimonas faecihominis]
MINGWRRADGQVDPRVRAKKMPDDVVKESLAYGSLMKWVTRWD